MTARRPAPLRWLWRAVRARPHLGLGVVAGVAALVLLPATVAPLTATILSWDFGCLVFLLVSAVAFSREHGGRMAADAERQQEGEWTIFWLTVGAVAASFAVIIEEFSAIKHVHGGPPALRNGWRSHDERYGAARPAVIASRARPGLPRARYAPAC